MQTNSSETIVHEIAESTDNDEELVSKMYADALEEYGRDARVFDYVPLFAAKRVRQNLKFRTATWIEHIANGYLDLVLLI